MKAIDIKDWPKQFTVNDWPNGVLEKMDGNLLTECLFPLRQNSGVPMWPSSLYGAHIRETGKSQHSIEGGRLATATDMHVSTIERMIKVMSIADAMPSIAGIGIYFDTKTPMIHIDSRETPLMWLCYKEKGKRIYLYRENGYSEFYKKLGELLCQFG